MGTKSFQYSAVNGKKIWNKWKISQKLKWGEYCYRIIRYFTPFTNFYRLHIFTIYTFLHSIFQDSLLNAIINDEVFGFIQCDIQTPNKIIQKHLRNGFLFPPIITRQVIQDDMLSPYMAKLQNKRKSKEMPSPIQTYNGQNLLLMTPLVQLYIKLGLKVSNITKFIQFIPGKGLLPFANKVVQLRSEATKDGDDAKQLTAKLYGNAGNTYVAYNMLHIICWTILRIRQTSRASISTSRYSRIHRFKWRHQRRKKSVFPSNKRNYRWEWRSSRIFGHKNKTKSNR